MGKMMDQGPVLIITFQAQVVMVIRSPKGDIVEGDPVSEPITAALEQGILNFSWTSLLLCSVWLCREKNPSVSDLWSSCPSQQGKVMRMMYVWALCRDQEELNPNAAWRLLDISASSTEQVL